MITDTIKKVFKRILHISHNDTDGYGCTTLTELIVNYYPAGMFSLNMMNIIPKNLYSSIKQALNEIENYDLIIITDLAVNQHVVDLIANSGYAEKFVVLDHHDAREIDVSKYPFLHLHKYQIENERDVLTELEYKEGYYLKADGSEELSDKLIPKTCGTELYYNFICNDNVFDLNVLSLPNNIAISHYVEVIRMYDTFSFDSDDSYISIARDDAPRFNTLFYALPHDDFRQYVDDYIHGHDIDWMQLTTSSKKYPWASKVIELENFRNEKYIKAALKKMQIVDLNKSIYKNGDIHNLNYRIGVIFAEKNGPMIGKAARDNNIDIDICAVVANAQVSFYQVKAGVDVSIPAKLLGGGGHNGASGFTISYTDANALNIEHFKHMIDIAGNITY